jgi:threonine synthase
VSADFDRNLELVRAISAELGIYVLNSVNPFRLEGQKAIIFEIIQQLRWQVPDWIVCPGGNLGNSSAFGKALREMYQLGLIDRIPNVAIIQAEGANPLYRAYKNNFNDYEAIHAETIATAIKIGNPVNYKKAVRTIQWTEGVVEEVTDQEIMDAKAQVDARGIGCEPASACSLAGTRKLVEKGIIKPHETVVGILTGHVLKDPDATINYHRNTLPKLRAKYPNHLFQAEPSIEEISRILTSERLVTA